MNALNGIRGNPNMEKMLGQLMSGMTPQMPTMPQQSMQGGMGEMGKLGVGHGFNKTRRFGLLGEGMTSFLSRYAAGLKYGDIKPIISTADLLKM